MRRHPIHEPPRVGLYEDTPRPAVLTFNEPPT